MTAVTKLDRCAAHFSGRREIGRIVVSQRPVEPRCHAPTRVVLDGANVVVDLRLGQLILARRTWETLRVARLLDSPDVSVRIVACDLIVGTTSGS